MTKPSTENLNLLINPENLQRLCKSISAIEAIISPEWEYFRIAGRCATLIESSFYVAKKVFIRLE